MVSKEGPLRQWNCRSLTVLSNLLPGFSSTSPAVTLLGRSRLDGGNEINAILHKRQLKLVCLSHRDMLRQCMGLGLHSSRSNFGKHKFAILTGVKMPMPGLSVSRW
ncbi:hypothetical protein FPOAC2_13196 [Fusarium poae]